MKKMRKRVFVVSDLHLNFIVEGTDFKHAVYDANLTCTTQEQRNVLFKELFFEHTTKMLPQEDTSNDILIIAGDTWEEHKMFSWNKLSWIAHVAQKFQHVVLVAGNHDYYGSNLTNWSTKAEKYLDELQIPNVHILDNSLWIDRDTNTVFCGGTLWTDMDRGNPLIKMKAPGTMIPDFAYIKWGTSYKRFTVDQWMMEHYKTVAYINKVCAEHKDKNVVAVTHHLPSYSLCDDKYAGEDSNHYYASSLDSLIENHNNLTHWIAGHTHSAGDLTINGTRCIVNPFGYVFTNERKENTGFEQGKFFWTGEG
jgi:metallophosphoesterase superfamily enzyme